MAANVVKNTASYFNFCKTSIEIYVRSQSIVAAYWKSMKNAFNFNEECSNKTKQFNKIEAYELYD